MTANSARDSQTTVADRIRVLVQQHLGLAPQAVTPRSSIFDDLGADSLDAVELLMAVEDEFHIEIPDNKAEAFSFVSDVIEYVEQALQHSRR